MAVTYVGRSYYFSFGEYVWIRLWGKRICRDNVFSKYGIATGFHVVSYLKTL